MCFQTQSLASNTCKILELNVVHLWYYECFDLIDFICVAEMIYMPLAFQEGKLKQILTEHFEQIHRYDLIYLRSKIQSVI